MSNIPETEKNKLFEVKMELETFAQEDDNKEITYDMMVSSKIDPLKIYPNNIKGDFVGHFKSISKIEFNPSNKYIF